MRGHPLRRLRDEGHVRGTERRRKRIQRRKKAAEWLSVSLESLRRRRRRLLLRQTVDAVVEKHCDHVNVVAYGVDPVRGANGAAVSVSHHDEYIEIGAVTLPSGGDRKRPPVQSVKAVRLQIVGKSTRASDSRYKRGLLGLELLGDEKLLDSGENRVITAARAPPGRCSLVVAESELALIVVEQRQNGAVCHGRSPVRVSTASRIAL